MRQMTDIPCCVETGLLTGSCRKLEVVLGWDGGWAVLGRLAGRRATSPSRSLSSSRSPSGTCRPGSKTRRAVSVLNRLGAALAWLSLRHLDSDVRLRDGLVRLRVRPLGYGEVVGVMFDMIRLLIEKATSHRLKPCGPASLDAPEKSRPIGDSCGQRTPAESGRRQPQRSFKRC